MPPEQMDMMQKMMQQMAGGPPAQSQSPYPSDVVMDGEEDGPHKHWTTVYPIYVDAKRRYRHGCRRIPYEKAVLFPNSLYLANAAKRLGLEYKHEARHTSSHAADAHAPPGLGEPRSHQGPPI